MFFFDRHPDADRYLAGGIRPVILTVAFLAATCALSWSQTVHRSWFTDLRGENSGHTACAFLSLPTSAGAMGKSPVASTGMLDATDVRSFTAATALAEYNQFSLSHLEWHMGLRNEFAGATFPLISIGTIGVFSQIFTAGSDQYAYDIDEQPSDFSMLECALGTSFARSFFERRLSTGAALYYIESRLDNIAGRALALSADCRYAPLEWIRSAAYVRNAGTDLVYSAASEPLPLESGVSIAVSPLSIHDPEYGPLPALTLSAGVAKTADEPIIAALGLEWKPARYVTLRSGYEHPTGAAVTPAGTSVGFGFTMKGYSIDGAWKYQSAIFGSVWAATVGMEIEPLTPLGAAAYQELAERSFGEGRYKDCIAYAKKALRLDPNLWKAHTLITRAQSEILRRKGLELVIIYTGNIRGQFLPPRHPDALGGIARMATVIATLRRQYPITLSVAAGNMITASSHEIKANIAQRYYRHVKHDAVCLGQGEFEYDLAWFLEADTMHVPFTSIEGEALGHKGIRYREIVEKGKYSFLILSAANTPESVKSLAARGTTFTDELRMELQRHDARKATARIVVLHDSWENIKSYAQALEGADLVICGSLASRFETPLKLGKALVVSAGNSGEFVGALTMRFDEKRQFLSYDNRLIPVAAGIAEDSAVATMVDAISAEEAEGNKQPHGIEPKKGSTQGVFPFLSTRNGAPALFLKIIEKLAEFPLASDTGAVATPAISFAAGDMAYAAWDSAGECGKLHAIDLSGTHKRLLADSVRIVETAFSPDGAWLYYTASQCGDTATDIFRMRPDSGVQFSVVRWEGSSERSIAFSPDFSQLVFCSNRDRTWQLYLTDPEGNRPLRLTDESGNHVQPRFSPNGASISYLSDNANPLGGMELWIFDRTTGTHRRLTENTVINSYCWLGDSRTIVYSSGLDFPELFVIRIDQDSAAPRILVTPPDGTRKLHKEINPRALSWKDRMKILYVREEESGERHIYWVSSDGSGDGPLVRSAGSDWLE